MTRRVTGPRAARRPVPVSLLVLVLCLIVSATAVTLGASSADRPGDEPPKPTSAIRVDPPRAPLALGRPGQLFTAMSAAQVGDTTGPGLAPVTVVPRLDPHNRTTVTASAPDVGTPLVGVPVGRRAPPAHHAT